MSIYLTEEKKKELNQRLFWLHSQEIKSEEMWGRIMMLQEILSESIVLPIEESWDDVIDQHDVEGACKKYYPSGVIIKK
jgi:hypothetical protein